MGKKSQKIPVLFVLIGWAKAYDGKHRPKGNHAHLKSGSPETMESEAFLKKSGKYSCGAGRGRLNERAMDVVFVARNPKSNCCEVVGIYRKAKPGREDAEWSDVFTATAIAFAPAERIECREWPNARMRLWAQRVDSTGKVHKELFKFYEKLNLSIVSYANKEELAVGNSSPDSDENEFPEGRKKARIHISKERSQALIKKTKSTFLKIHGRLFCQICAFDFKEKYGKYGDGYIEVHHTIPVEELTEDSKTKVSDMAIVCSNCHRMLHRRRPWLSLQDLEDLVRPLLDFH